MYQFKDAASLTKNDFQKQDYDDFNLDLFKSYSKTNLRNMQEKKMIQEFEDNSDFAGVVSLKWIKNHTASSTKLKEMNEKLAVKA